METAPPALIPAPAIMETKGKPVIIRPPEVSGAHDFAIIGYILTFLMSIPWLIIALVIGGIGVAAYLGYAILPPVLPVYLSGIPLIGAFLIFLTFTLSPSFLIYIGLGGAALFAVIIFLGTIYFGMVRNITKGRYEKARNSALFFGVLFIIPAFFVLFAPTIISGVIIAIIPAFFFLMTYGKLGEVIAKYGPVAIMGEAMPGAPFAGPQGGPGLMAMGAPMPGAPFAGPPGGPGPMPMGGPMPMPPMQPMTGVAPRVPLCPGCGKELYYSANHRRWYCMTCDNPTGHR
jgi:hypothetical protein